MPPERRDEDTVRASEIFWIIGIVVATVGAIAILVYYFVLTPPPTVSLDEVAARWQEEKEQTAMNTTLDREETLRQVKCGSGVSGSICRLGQQACSTALGSYFCELENREDDY